jgi:two-component system chemotaxis response regulator CheY
MKILIVDDSRVMRMLVRRTLRQANIGEHEVEEAGNGVEALEKLKTFHADWVLSDWNMPEMDGPALMNALKDAEYPGKIGFVTSQSAAEARNSLLSTGAAFLITKPFTADDFEAIKWR